MLSLEQASMVPGNAARQASSLQIEPKYFDDFHHGDCPE
jgi:hypothetical protein